MEVGDPRTGASLATAFERHAQQYLSRLWNTSLAPRRIQLAPGLSKSFDLVSEDSRFVGDAKWMKNIPVPSAKWSVIAEYVWLLQHVPDADKRFIVFGQDREVADRWLNRFQSLTDGVNFYYLAGDGLIDLKASRQ